MLDKKDEVLPEITKKYNYEIIIPKIKWFGWNQITFFEKLPDPIKGRPRFALSLDKN